MDFGYVFDDGDKEFKSLTQLERVKVVAYVHYLHNDTTTFTPSDLTDLFLHYNLDVPSNIHRELSMIINKKPKDIIKNKKGYSLERNYIQKMTEKYGSNYSKTVNFKLSDLLNKVNDENQKRFLEDALKCFNAKIYRPAIIMTWLVVLDIIYDHVLSSKLNEFNLELAKQNKKSSVLKKTDFENIKESIFVELLRSSSIISKEQKKILDEKLSIRNSAAHPNQTSFKESKVATFIEELFTDILDKLN